MNQPLDDLQDGQKDGLAFYSIPLADRVDRYKNHSQIAISEIKVPQAVFEKGKSVVDDHPLLKLYRDFKALKSAHTKSVGNLLRMIKFNRIHTTLSELIEKQQISPLIDDNTFKHPELPFLEHYRAIIEAKIKQYRSPKEMILNQYEVFPSNLRHPHSIVRQVAWLLLGRMIEYHSPELRTAQAVADNASYRRQIIPKLSGLFEPLHQALKDPDAGVCYHVCCTLQEVVDQLMKVMNSATVQTEFHKFDYISVLKDRLLDPESDLMILDLLNITLHYILLHKQIILASCSSIPKAELLYQRMRLKCFPSLAAEPKFTEVYDYFKQADKPSNDDQLLWEILQTRYALDHLHNSSKKIEELLSKKDYKGIHQLLDDPYLTNPAAFTPVLIRKLRCIIDRNQKGMRKPNYRWSMGSFEQQVAEEAKLLDKMQQVKQCWEQQKRSEGLKTQGSIHRASSSPNLKMPDLFPSIAQQASSSAQSEAMPLSPRRQNANKGESKWKVSHVETTPPSPSGQGGKKSCCIS